MKHNKIQNKTFRLFRLLTVPVLVLAVFLQNPIASHAAQLTEATVLFDRMQTSTATAGTVCADPTTSGTVANVAVTFPTGYTIATTSLSTNWAVSTTNLAWPTGGTAWPGISYATTAASGVVTFPSSNLTPGTLYCFNWTNSAAVTTPSSTGSTYTGSIATETSGLSVIDSESYTTDVISSDQISVTATVPEAFTLALGSSTDNLSTLSSLSVSSSSSPITVTVNTNASNGWQVWAKDANTGLRSPTAGGTGHTIASTTLGGSPVQVVAGTEGYNTGVTSSLTAGSSITVAAGFVGTTAHYGGGLTTTYSTIASSTGPDQAAVLSLTDNVAISAITPAGSNYADTITVVGGGLF